jgi:glycine cleavage system H protein
MPEASYPHDLLYHGEHGWAHVQSDTATFGITWFAQDSLQEVVFFDPPTPGVAVAKDQVYAEIESVKAVSELYSPLSGEIVQVNDVLAEAPTTINTDPYGRGWLVKVRLSDPTEVRSLMNAEQYKATLAS